MPQHSKFTSSGQNAAAQAQTPEQMGKELLDTVTAYKCDHQKAIDLIGKGASLEVKNSAGVNPLIAASAGGFSDIVRALVDKGAKINEKDLAGNTALIAAAREGNAEIAVVLLAKGADVTQRNDSGHNARDEATGHPEILYAIGQAEKASAKIGSKPQAPRP